MIEKDEGEQEAWDDVKGGELPIKEVKAARKEEFTYMEKREIWGLSPNRSAGIRLVKHRCPLGGLMLTKEETQQKSGRSGADWWPETLREGIRGEMI